MKIIIVLVGALFSLPAFAVQLPAPALPDPIPANVFLCKGKGVTVSFASTSLTGEARIQIKFRKRAIEGSGEEISIQETALGPLVSVAGDAAPDLFTERLSIVLPSVNLRDGADSAKFSTLFFTTRSFTSIGGPALVAGALQSTSATPLKCQASAVVF